MSREFRAPLIILLALVALGIWIARNTYWESTEVSLPMQPVAAMNPNYGLAVLVRLLGASVRHSALSASAAPAPGALLILTNISPGYAVERAGRLRSWVERGGQALIGADLLEADPKLQHWAGISTYTPLQSAKSGEKKGPDEDCGFWHGDAEPERYRVCASTGSRSLLIGRATQWEIRDEVGIQAARVRIGSGSLTVIASPAVFANLQLRRGDNARLFLRATHFQAGDAVWFVDPPVSESLLRLLWRVGAPLLLLALALVALLLWRMMDRLGPLEAEPGSARRSLREQIAGNANFAWRMHDLRGLYGAQRRALEEAAARRIRNFRQLNWHDQAARVAALARQDPKSLELAIMDAGRQERLVVRDHLWRMERARRALRAGQDQ